MLLFWCPDRSKRSFYGTFSRHLLPKIFFVFTCEHSSLFMVFFTSCMTIPLLIFKTFVFFPGSINRPTLREKWAYSEFFWSLFSLIWTKYGELRSISLYSVRMRENTDQKNSEYRHFSRCAKSDNENWRHCTQSCTDEICLSLILSSNEKLVAPSKIRK